MGEDGVRVILTSHPGTTVSLGSTLTTVRVSGSFVVGTPICVHPPTRLVSISVFRPLFAQKCLYMYTCIYAYMFIYVYAYMCICLYRYIDVYVIYVCVYVYTHIYVCICKNIVYNI